jgi:glycerate dehydrogenase
LIGQEQLEMMKSNAILVNVGRGGIVHEGELAQAISDNKIGGACMDVFGKEPIEADNPLLKVTCPDKLVLSPHNAWASIEARTKLIDIVIENIRSFLEK